MRDEKDMAALMEEIGRFIIRAFSEVQRLRLGESLLLADLTKQRALE